MDAEQLITTLLTVGAPIGGACGWFARELLKRYDAKVAADREDKAAQDRHTREQQDVMIATLREVNQQASATADKAADVALANRVALTQISSTMDSLSRKLDSGLAEILSAVKKPGV